MSGVASSPAEASAPKLRPFSLLVALAIMIGGSIDPFVFARPDGSADHGFATLIFWAMSAGLVNGVGFVPRWPLWRWLFSGWACLAALTLAAWMRLG
ncbi:MAG: cyd operon YbgE family protein [Rhodoferax sp.]|nr:cyd operon YbgE family protein [Rhodoferax sp.]MDR3368524.1 cyd operon YbgE family protein [Rhodoferax sp.]